MKKILIISALALLFSNISFGQESKKFTYGPRLGLNVSFFNTNLHPNSSWLHPNSSWENYGRISPFIGAFVNYKFSKVFSIQTELLYTLKGGSSRKPSNSIMTQTQQGYEQAYYYTNYRINYIELPLLAQINLFPNKSGVHYSVQTGIAPSISMTSTLRANDYTVGSGVGLVQVREKWQVKDFYEARKFNASMIIGMHFGFLGESSSPFGRSSGSFALDIRYTKSLLDTYKTTIFYPTGTQNLTMHTISLGLSGIF